MTSTDRITLHYMPQTRAAGTRIILEELGAPYDLHVMNMKAGENREPGYLSINPLGKVPAIEHRGRLVTEQIAIAIYLGDLFPEAGLTPAVDDPDRGPYLRWLVYYAACFEPALMDKFRNVDPGPITQSVYGTYDLMLDTLEGALSNGPYILGNRLSLADIQWGVALRWTMMFGIVPERPRFVEYRDRLIARPSFAKVWNEDAALAEKHAALAAAKA
ncbi:MAG TPA: glutathione S-transferase family protein [Ensifer sp.]|nr:glutathione S-transferase family protein [Ensifer sp.]